MLNLELFPRENGKPESSRTGFGPKTTGEKMTLNKFSLKTGMLMPALPGKSSAKNKFSYDSITAEIATVTHDAAKGLEIFEARVVSLGFRATEESFSEYFAAKTKVIAVRESKKTA